MALPIPTMFLGSKSWFLPASIKRASICAPFSYTKVDRTTAKCNENGSPSSREVIWGMVEELLSKEENKDLLAGLEEASQRVEIAQRELAQIQQQEAEARLMREYVAQLESRTAEIEECQREISEAKAMLEEAEKSLNGNETVDKNAERLESVKAASVSGVVGTLAQLPFSLAHVSTSSQLIFPLAVAFVTCALFGVTYRYAVRRDLDNTQLKLGATAAFGFTKGLGMLEAGHPLELESSSILSHGFEGLFYVSESLAVFLFAGVALDLCIKLRIIKPFTGLK